jgi:hypothetical protein
VRQTRSIALPAVTGTEMRTGLLGHCVCAGVSPCEPSISKEAATKARHIGSLNLGLSVGWAVEMRKNQHAFSWRFVQGSPTRTPEAEAT